MAKNSGTSSASGGQGDSGRRNWLAILRIYIGAYFIHTSLDKFTATYIGQFSRLVERWAHDSSYEWYRSFLTHYVIPHEKFFAYLTAIGEFYVGLSLVIGFLSGLAAILGILFYANYYLGTSEGEILWHFGTMVVCLFVIFFTGAGRIWGFDKHLSKKIHIKYIV